MTDIAKTRERLAAATPGPWAWFFHPFRKTSHVRKLMPSGAPIAETDLPEDMKLIAHLRNEVPAMLDELERLRTFTSVSEVAAELERLRVESQNRREQWERLAKKLDCHPSYVNETLDQNADELETLRAAQQWQPIETAPRGGTKVLVLWRGREIAISHFNSGLEGFRECTHWMPLPGVPE